MWLCFFCSPGPQRHFVFLKCCFPPLPRIAQDCPRPATWDAELLRSSEPCQTIVFRISFEKSSGFVKNCFREMFQLSTLLHAVCLSLNKEKKAAQGPQLQERVHRQFSLCFAKSNSSQMGAGGPDWMTTWQRMFWCRKEK